jgi:hypothetical protein
MAYFPTIAIGVPFFRAYAGFSQEALDWQARIIANGGTIPDATLAIFDNNFFKPAKANGNILSELDRLNIYCGLNGFQIAARTNMIKSAHYVTPVSSPTFDNNGYKSAGTGYLNLNYNPFTQGVLYDLNSACTFYVAKTPTFLAKNPIGAVESGSLIRSQLELTTTQLQANISGFISVNNLNITNVGNVFMAGQRTSSTNVNSIINASVVSGVQGNTGVVNLSLFELVLRFDNSPFGPFDTDYHLCSGNGSGSLDLQGLRVILNNLFTALGV